MKTNVHEIKFLLRKRMRNVDHDPIGSRLKYKRKQLNLTLEEGAHDICSVSYLSKVENNLIIPTDKYIIRLKDKYQMKDEPNENFNYDDILDEMIHAFFLEKACDIVIQDEVEDYQRFMIKFAYYVISKQYDKADDMFKDMQLFIPNLPIKSLNFLLALANKLLYVDLKYSDAKGLLMLMNLEEDDIIIKLIHYKWLLKNATKLSQVLLFEKIYPIYKEELIKNNYFNELKEIELERQIMYQNISGFKIDYYKNNIEELSYYQVKSLYQKNKYQDVINLTKDRLNDYEYLIYHLLSLDKLKKREPIVKIIRAKDIKKQDHKSAWLLTRHFKYKYVSSKEEQLLYLRNEILGYKHLTDEISVLYYLMMDAFNIFKSYHFYKEATEIIDKYLPMIRLLNYN